MERAAESVEVAKIAQDGLEAPLFQRRNHWLILTLQDDSLFVETKNVHVDPLAGHVERVLVRHDCFRSVKNIPASEYLRHFENALGIDQQLTGRQRHQRRVDVHGVWIVKLK